MQPRDRRIATRPGTQNIWSKRKRRPQKIPPTRQNMSVIYCRQFVIALITYGCAAYVPLTSVNKLALSSSSKFKPAASLYECKPRNRASVVGLRLSVSEDKGTARAVGERDSGRHLDDNSQRAQAVSDLYTPFWNYAAEVEPH